MELFQLPLSAKVNKVIPKNTFDKYTSAKQKKVFADLVQRITWRYKLSPDTVNLEAKEIKEIQIFRVELKRREPIDIVLSIIDKAIPYNIIFIVEHHSDMYLLTSAKHPHPVNENNAVIDWTFKSEWFQCADNKYHLVLGGDLDMVYRNFCTQLSGNPQMEKKSIRALIEHNKLKEALTKEADKLKSEVSNSKQFNQKVELNIQLKKVEKELSMLLKKTKTRNS